jgi:hypothetical protein
VLSSSYRGPLAARTRVPRRLLQGEGQEGQVEMGELGEGKEEEAEEAAEMWDREEARARRGCKVSVYSGQKESHCF